MKTIEMYEPHDYGYSRICDFAKINYIETLSIKIMHFPDILFAIEDNGKIFGCIGLNRELRFNLFKKDGRLRKIQNKALSSGKSFCEQSILATEQYPAGMLILIAALVAYTQKSHIDNLVYAGIDVTKRTIAHLGFPVTEIGTVNLKTLLPEELQNYITWYRMHSPTTCFLSTSTGIQTYTQLMNRLEKKIQNGSRLSSFLYCVKESSEKVA